MKNRAPRAEREPRQVKGCTVRRRRRAGFALAAAISTVALSGAVARAQENFTWQGGAGTGEDWELPANWTGGTGFVSQYPGDAAVDSANLNVNLGGNLGVVIDGKSITLGTLTLGAADGAFTTTVSAPDGITLGASNIATLGAAGATNILDLDLVMPNGNLVILADGTNALTLNGSLLNNAPTAGTPRNVQNDSGQRLTINGNVVLSDAADAAGFLRFQNNAAETETFINGVISDGAATGGRVNYARGTFHIMGANTYTGNTQLGENSPNSPANHIVYTDTPFGTGRLIFSGQSAVKTVEAAAGLGTRTLANEIQLSRPGGVTGSESIVLNGQIYQSNSTSFTNNIAAGKTLTINGNVFAANSSDNRAFTFNGTGTTIINGVVDDTTTGTAAGSLRHDGAGRTVLANAGSAAYDGSTEVFNGTLQLGTGGAAVNIPATVVAGGAATTGTLEINHTGSMSLDAVPTQQLGINHVAGGTTTLSKSSFASAGTINVDAGTLIINGGDFAGSVIPNAVKNSGRELFVGNNSGLTVGQPLTATGTGDITVPAGTYITGLVGSHAVAVNNTLGGSSGSATNEITFAAGTGTGTSNVIVDAGATVAGTGTVGGLLGVNGTVAPGVGGIGTLTANGNAVVNGTLAAEFDGTGAGSSDLLDVLGALTLGANSTLDLSQLNLGADDPAYVIASYGSLSGTFGSVLDLPAGYGVSYNFNDGASSNNIAIVVPEPAGLALLALGAVPLLHRRRRAGRA